MLQSKLGSLIESLVNIVIGFTINFIANLVILPLFGFEGLTLKTNFYIGLAYTAVSIVRQYVIRRWFNGRVRFWSMRIAGEKVENA